MMEKADLVIIGAGPAGMCAAIEAARHNLSVVVLDEQPRPGGQIWRAIETADALRSRILGPDYIFGAEVAAEFRASPASYRPGALVWHVSADRVVDYSQNGSSKRIQADRIVVATGALERPMPVPGWTLPGVSTAGALQILLKSSGVLPKRAVIAGSGPLIWLIAAQMVDAGAPPLAVLDTTPKRRMRRVFQHMGPALRGRAYLIKGLKLMAKVRLAQVPVFSHAEGLRILGEDAVSGVSFRHRGVEKTIQTASVALHQGVVPNQQLSRLLRCEHDWDAEQFCFRPRLDDSFASSVPGVHIIGDGAGIQGARSAALQGRLLGLMLAERAGRPVDPGALARYRRQLSADGAVRPLLEAIFAPSDEVLNPADDTIVCRCEEVTAGQIRSAVDTGSVTGPNQVKAMLRSGMGPCQGRVCGPVVTQIVSQRLGQSQQETDYFRIRPPLKPLTIAELAAARPGPGQGSK